MTALHEVLESDGPVGPYKFRSYHHAMGFLSRVLSRMPHEFITHMLKIEQLEHSDVHALWSEAPEILQAWRDRAHERGKREQGKH
jgi:hypothetical protein